MMRNIFLFVVSFAVGFSSASEDGFPPQEIPTTEEDFVNSDPFQDLVALKKDEVFTGELGDHCVPNSSEKQCREGLQCEGFLYETCQPINCYDRAVQAYNEQFNLDEYTGFIMREAGLEGRDDFYEKGDGWFGFLGTKIKPEVEQAVLGALMDNPPPIEIFRTELKKHCGDVDKIDDNSIKARQATVDGSVVYTGILFKGSAGFRFSNSYYFAQGNVDNYGAWYSDLCFGAGPEAGAKMAALVGTIYSGTRRDLEGSSCGFGCDFTPFIGYGLRVGFGLLNGVARVNNQIGTGFIFGFGGDWCQTFVINDLQPPTGSPSDSPTDSISASPSVSLKPSVSNAPSNSPSVSMKPSISNAPSKQPTPSPTPSPTNAPACFSEDDVVHVQDLGYVGMKDLQLGDAVLAKNGNYQKIYAFAHKQDNQKEADFLVLQTNETTVPALEVTPNHLMYLHTQPDDPVVAKDIKVGDILTYHYSNNSTESQMTPAMVTDIKTVTKQGVYLPLTPDGTLVVNGMKASLYSSSPSVEGAVSWVKPILSLQTLAHWWAAPIRMMCLGSPSTAACESYNDNDLLVWLDFGRTMTEHMVQWNPILQAVFALFVALLMGVVRFVEIMFWNGYGYTVLVATLPLILIRKASSKVKK